MSFERDEMEDMVRRWAAASRKAEASADWATHLGPFYADDAECRVHIGADYTYVGRGAAEIRAGLLGEEMVGFDGWTYPHDRVVIDPVQGTVVFYWRQVSPYVRRDGSPYAVRGHGTSFFRYGGGFQWTFQEDVFDMSQVTALFMELAADGYLSLPLKGRIRRLAWGAKPRGYETPSDAPSTGKKARAYLALGRIALFGR